MRERSESPPRGRKRSRSRSGRCVRNRRRGAVWGAAASARVLLLSWQRSFSSLSQTPTTYAHHSPTRERRGFADPATQQVHSLSGLPTIALPGAPPAEAFPGPPPVSTLTTVLSSAPSGGAPGVSTQQQVAQRKAKEIYIGNLVRGGAGGVHAAAGGRRGPCAGCCMELSSVLCMPCLSTRGATAVLPTNLSNQLL